MLTWIQIVHVEITIACLVCKKVVFCIGAREIHFVNEVNHMFLYVYQIRGSVQSVGGMPNQMHSTDGQN